MHIGGLVLPQTGETKAKKASERARITPRSQSLVYEVQLKELFDAFPKSPSKERVRICFEILDEVIPFLGTMSPVVKTIRDELFRSVYSKNLTSSDKPPYVERIPFFSAVGKIDEARHEEITKTNEAVTELQQKIKFRDHDLQVLYKKNMALKQEISEHEGNEKGFQERINNLENMLQKYEMEKNEMRIYHQSKEDTLKREIEKLQGMVEYDVYQAERLQDQFAEILNYQLDDFELSLGQLKKKREILLGVVSNESDRETSYKLEMHEIIAGFRRRVSDILEEQKLLKTHLKGLKLVHQDYTSDNQTVKRTADVALRKYAIVFDYPSLKLRSKYKREELTDAMDTDDESVAENEDENFQLSKTMKIIWSDYYENRNGFKPKLSRSFTLPRIISLIQEVYDARWTYEEDRYEKVEAEKKDDSEVVFTKFVEFFYDYMTNRYQLAEIAQKAIHDIFTALNQYEEQNTYVALFIRHLCGMEDVAWKYLYLSKLLLAKYEPVTISKYRQMLTVMYPSRPREMYEQMELELIAFCKNKFTREMVEEHLVHMIISGIEPNQKYFQGGLKRFDYQDNGFMAYDDFDEALGQLLPVAPARMKKTMYRLAELDHKRDEVPLPRLSQLTSYIALYCCYKNAWVPQALISPDFGTGGEAGGNGDGDASNEVNQEEIDGLLKGNDVSGLDNRAIDAEEMKLIRRLEMMAKASGEESDNDSDD
ncbi:hypothetical protein HDU97_003096 [Phlyctochytrium planicorne]|nr:hypothetical protein HDU97_003048 [Phlyctochytrium planicorne]KAJ3109668.1 hypothetical protein HDU97_003096 [Phlyctochytrium planicorne]